MSMWADLQEAFYILFGPFIASILLPVFIAAGLLMAMLMATARFWRPKDHIEVTIVGRQDGDE